MSIQITTRAGKGQPLTAAEIDANFTNLRDAIEGLDGLGIESATATPQGDMTLVLTNGETIGPIKLPTKTIRPRGVWVSGAAYIVGDVVRIDGSTYYVVADHVAAGMPGVDIGAGRIVILAQKGADGAGLAEAPSDGTPYVRQDGTWTPMPVPEPSSGGGSGGGMFTWKGPMDELDYRYRIKQFDVVSHGGSWWVALQDFPDPMQPGAVTVYPGLPYSEADMQDDGFWGMLTFPLLSAGPATFAIQHRNADNSIAQLGAVIHRLEARISALEETSA